MPFVGSLLPNWLISFENRLPKVQAFKQVVVWGGAVAPQILRHYERLV